MGGLILTLAFRKCFGTVPELFPEMILFLTLVAEQASSRNVPCRFVPGTFPEELCLGHASKLLQARKGEAYELRD